MIPSEFLSLLITQIWQVTLLIGVVWIVSRLFASNRPHLAHALWMLVLLKCLTPPVWSSPTSGFSWLSAVRTESADTLPIDSPPTEKQLNIPPPEQIRPEFAELNLSVRAENNEQTTSAPITAPITNANTLISKINWSMVALGFGDSARESAFWSRRFDSVSFSAG